MALFSRLKTWIQNEKLTFSDLNAEFDNILTNSTADKELSNIAFAAEATPDPGAVNASVADELKWLRSQIHSISGQSQWSTAIPLSLSDLSQAIGSVSPTVSRSKIVSGYVDANGQPNFLQGSTIDRKVTLKGGTTPFVFYADGTKYTISSNVASANTATAPIADTTTGGLSAPVILTNDQKVVVPVQTPANVPAAIQALEGKFIALQSSTRIAVGKLARNSYEGGTPGVDYYFINDAKTETFFFDSSGIPLTAGTAGATSGVLTVGYVFVTSALTVKISSVEPVVSGTAPSDTSVYWFDVVNGIWKTYDGASWVSAASCCVGVALFNATQCVGVRAFDFFANYTAANNLSLRVLNNSTKIFAESPSSVNVYGSMVQIPAEYSWTISSDCAEGAPSALTTYYLYIKKDGTPIYSSVVPVNRDYDLYGIYHPNKPWRCVGKFYLHNTSPLIYAVTPIQMGQFGNDAIRDISIKPRKIINTLQSYALAGANGGYTKNDAQWYLVYEFKAINEGRPFMVKIQNGLVKPTDPTKDAGMHVYFDTRNTINNLGGMVPVINRINTLLNDINTITSDPSYVPSPWGLSTIPTIAWPGLEIIVPPYTTEIGQPINYKVYVRNLTVDANVFSASGLLGYSPTLVGTYI